MATIQIYKSRYLHFALALTVSETLTFKMFDRQKVGQAQGTIFGMTAFDGKCQNL